MAPRVLIDATAVPGDRGGVGRYVDGLIRSLGQSGEDLVVVCQRADAERFSRLSPGTEVIAGPSAISHRPARLAWEQTGLPLIAQQTDASLIHSPYYTMPLHASVPVVVTVHDVTFISEPELHSAVRAGFYRSATRTAVRRAARVIVPSQATKDELVRLVDGNPETIDVARHGVDLATFHPPTDAETQRVSDRLGLHGRPYVAFLGVLERRKNVPDLVRGWVQAVIRPARAARTGPRRKQRLGRRGRPGDRRRAVVAEGGAARFHAPVRPARSARRGPGRRVPQQGRGLRPAGARGDGVRCRGPHGSSALAPRGGWRRGGVHRARQREHRQRPCAG